MKRLRVKNFNSMQHYHDEKRGHNPPWIKLYNSILDDYSFTQLDDAQKYHVLAMSLLASRTKNNIPFDANWIAGKISATSPVNLETLTSSTLIELFDDSTQNDSHASINRREESRTEKKRKEENIPPTPKAEPPGFSRFWQTWPSHCRKAARSECLRKWHRHGCEAITEQVISAVERCKASRDWQKANGEFIPAPLTWLNQRRWDAPSPPQGSVQSVQSDMPEFNDVHTQNDLAQIFAEDDDGHA